MATKGTNQAVLVDEFIFNGDTSAVTTSISVAELDKTNIASTAMEYIPGLSEWRIAQNGYWSGPDADGMADELHDRLGTSGAVVSHIPDRTSTGTPTYTIPNAFNATLPIEAPADGIITMNGEWAASEGGHRGELVTYNTTISGTGNGTSIDLGSAGSAGGYFYLHVHTIDGDDSGTSTNSAIKLQSSSDNISFADEATITFSATGGNTATLSGTVNRYIRISTTSMGGASSITATAIAVVSGVTET